MLLRSTFDTFLLLLFALHTEADDGSSETRDSILSLSARSDDLSAMCTYNTELLDILVLCSTLVNYTLLPFCLLCHAAEAHACIAQRRLAPRLLEWKERIRRSATRACIEHRSARSSFTTLQSVDLNCALWSERSGERVLNTFCGLRFATSLRTKQYDDPSLFCLSYGWVI